MLKVSQNVLIASVSSIHVKLADFGISKCTTDTYLRTKIGTQAFLAPEFQGFWPPGYLPRNEYTNAVDLWALGCIVYQMLCSQVPFTEMASGSFIDESGLCALTSSSCINQGDFSMHLLSEFCNGRIDLPLGALHHSRASKSAIEFLKQLLVADPRSRISAASALKSKWCHELPQAVESEEQNSRTPSLVDMILNYERVGSDNMGTKSTPAAYLGEPEPYSPKELEEPRLNPDPTFPQHVGDYMATVTKNQLFSFLGNDQH